jgi:pyruvate formate lyase activating enzyme
MNRRRFLIDACTLIGGGATLGHLLPELPMNSNTLWPSVAQNSSVSDSDPEDEAGKALLSKLERAGIEPREAMYWETLSGNRVRCTLCPTFCVLRPYQRGRCRVRLSLGNRLATLVYGRPCSIAIDPIEKKPVFHLLPGTGSFSIATAGCLLSCRYCQNWQISQANPEDLDHHALPPAAVVEGAVRSGSASIAYTYTEPTIFYEYMIDTARLARAAGVKNVVISCGYINPDPLRELCGLIDVMKVDLKAFTESFYREMCGGTLGPVLKTLETLADTKTLFDIVTLIVPTLNDDEDSNRRMFTWIRDRLGPLSCLFLSRFHPTFRLRNLPSTPVSTLERLRQIARDIGLKYVYIGNVPGHEGEHTFCHACGKRIIERVGYHLGAIAMKDGACAHCGTHIPGIWQ